VYHKYAQSKARRLRWLTKNRAKAKKYAPRHKFVTFFSPAPDFLTSYNGTPFTNTPSHTATAETQFVSVFRALRFS
jgi:hypothetical protein